MNRIFLILHQNNCNLIIVISLLLFSVVGQAQQTLSGIVVDQLDETSLLGTTLLIESKQKGVVTDFDWIGLFSYPQQSKYTLENIDKPLSSLINTHNKKLMIVETGYPFTLDNADAAANVLGSDALAPGFSAAQKGQLDFLKALITKTKAVGDSGIIYWEPAWASTNCKTRRATKSHWGNETLFDADGKVNMGIKFYNKLINQLISKS